MKTEYRLAFVLKQLMSENKSLDDISVTLLTKKCHVNRQTFYYHFHDIYDLLTLVFLNEEIPHIKEVNNIDELVETIFAYYKNNANFLDGVLQSAGKELLSEFLFNNCFHAILRIVNTYPESKKIIPSDRKAIARFYASGYSNCITFYLSNIKRKTIDGLKAQFLANSKNLLQNSIENIINARKINAK